jgi:hypothetical protein
VPIIHNGKIYSTNGVGRPGHSHTKKVKLDPYLIAHLKINLKYIKDLKVSPKSI